VVQTERLGLEPPASEKLDGIPEDLDFPKLADLAKRIRRYERTEHDVPEAEETSDLDLVEHCLTEGQRELVLELLPAQPDAGEPHVFCSKMISLSLGDLMWHCRKCKKSDNSRKWHCARCNKLRTASASRANKIPTVGFPDADGALIRTAPLRTLKPKPQALSPKPLTVNKNPARCSEPFARSNAIRSKPP